MTIIDVRQPFEYQASHAEGSINIPLQRLPQAVADGTIEPDEELVLYCNSGGRSAQAEQFLKANGFADVTNGINQQAVEQKFI